MNSIGSNRRALDSGDVTPVSESCSAPLAGGTYPTVSGDGSTIVYVKTGDGPMQSNQLWIHEGDGARHERVVDAADGGPPDGPSMQPSISADGRWLAFASRATNLTAGRVHGSAEWPVEWQVYLQHLGGSPVLLISATARNEGGNGPSRLPAVDADGLHVVFESRASDFRCARPAADQACRDINLVSDVMLWSLESGTLVRLSDSSEGPWLEASVGPAISGDGRWSAFLSRHPVDDGDGRDTFDVFLSSGPSGHGREDRWAREARAVPYAPGRTVP